MPEPARPAPVVVQLIGPVPIAVAAASSQPLRHVGEETEVLHQQRCIGLRPPGGAGRSQVPLPEVAQWAQNLLLARRGELRQAPAEAQGSLLLRGLRQVEGRREHGRSELQGIAPVAAAAVQTPGAQQHVDWLHGSGVAEDVARLLRQAHVVEAAQREPIREGLEAEGAVRAAQLGQTRGEGRRDQDPSNEQDPATPVEDGAVCVLHEGLEAVGALPEGPRRPLLVLCLQDVAVCGPDHRGLWLKAASVAASSLRGPPLDQSKQCREERHVQHVVHGHNRRHEVTEEPDSSNYRK
mmetsp:Transcript_80077/g.246936  ORF Transcript_80077/g.246936 Transcript_80077/m.246936 type:complete len:295 (+) Transcript_80077:1002-1886(+)